MSIVYIVRRNDELDVYDDYDDAVYAAILIGGFDTDVVEEVVISHGTDNAHDWLAALREEYGVDES